MPVSPHLRQASLLAFLVPAIALSGALVSQYQFGLAPCEMCHWQRWPHYAALAPALVALLLPLSPSTRRGLTIIAALLIAVSGVIGVYHAGVEYQWWEGFTTCTAPVAASLEDIMNAPLIRCDVPAFVLFGISMAGYNALASLGGAAIIAWLLSRSGQQG